MDEREGRIISIVHRVKATAEGEARPTMIAMKEGEKMSTYKLETEQNELDFVLGRFPTKWRAYIKNEDLASFKASHIQREKKTGEPTKVAIKFDGIKSGDRVLMTLGGSGDRLAFSIFRKLKIVGGKIIRVAPFHLKDARGAGNKEDDHKLLIQLYANSPELFQFMTDRDLDLIKVREAYFARTEAMKARIGCEQRLRQRIIGRIFLSEEGGYPEGLLEDEYDKAKANDVVFKSLHKEEAQRELEMKKAVHKLEVWENIFEPLEGVGEAIAARLIVAIGDIRRFSNAAKLKKYCGVHVLPDGRFPRQRNNERANWKPEARQALYLLGDQFNRRAKSVWGLKLREYKARFREKYPEPIKAEGAGGKMVTKYSDGHIHKMATWRTLTKFVEWLFDEWTALENKEKIEKSKAA